VTEDPVRYNPKQEHIVRGSGHDATDVSTTYHEISRILNKHLGSELLEITQMLRDQNEDRPDSEESVLPFRNSPAYRELVDITLTHVSDTLGRPLNAKECSFISGHIEAFLKNSGI
jgi:hypothetical protein